MCCFKAEMLTKRNNNIVPWPVSEEVQQMDFPNPSAKKISFSLDFWVYSSIREKNWVLKRNFIFLSLIFSKYAGLWSLGKMYTNVDTWVKIWNHAWDHPGSCRSQINFKPRMNTDRLKLVLKRYNSHRGRASFQSLSISASPLIEVQSPLGFATMGLAANLGLATSRALTDSVST